MLRIAALILASAAGTMAAAASTSSSDTLVPNAPWWEKVTVTMDSDGQPQSCRYETSLAAAAEACDVASPDAASATKASTAKGELTRITFERRFTPGAAPAKPQLATGDTLLGGQVMALAIDAKGSVKGCRVVSTTGSVQPEYGCSDASAERFQASLGNRAAAASPREGYMTIIVYGHSEHVA